MSTFDAIVMLVVIYLRVSTEEQKTRGYSLPEQREMCRKKAEELAQSLRSQGKTVNLEIVEFEDAISGDFLERPALDEAREFVKTRRPAAFVCLDPDRFSRDLMNQLIITEEIEKQGIELVFVQHNYDRSPEGKMFYQFRGAISQYEKAKILERMARGRRGKLRKGLIASHTAIYGYRYDKTTSSMVVYEEEAHWVRLIYQWADERVRTADIADRLNAMGVQSRRGTKWYRSAVRGILANTTYYGEMRCNRWDWRGAAKAMQLPKAKRTAPIKGKERPRDEWVIIQVPPIIDRTLYDAVQALVKTRKKQSRRGTQLLSGMMRCGLCGESVHYNLHTDGSYTLRCMNKYPRTRDTKRPREKCDLPHVSAHIIERKVWAEVEQWVLDPNVLIARFDERESEADGPDVISDIESHIHLLNERLVDFQKEQVETLRQKAKGNLDAEVAELLLSETKTSIDAVRRDLDEAGARLVALYQSREMVTAFRDRVAEMQRRITDEKDDIQVILSRLTLEHKQQFLRTFVREVTVYPGRACVVHPLFPES